MIERLPQWFKQDIIDGKVSGKVQFLLACGTNTVCQQAKCPNLNRCFKDNHFTFLILGSACTRGCRFCAVEKAQGRRLPLDIEEPYRLTEAVRKLRLKYVIVTSVTRDDLSDGGAEIFAKTIELLRGIDEDIGVEVLIPDFGGNFPSLKRITAAQPNILAHNLETIARLYPFLRPQADYQRSLGLLRKAKEYAPDLITKSSLILGLGEAPDEVIGAMRDLRKSRVDILTLGQYLAPSADCYPVKAFISPEQFIGYHDIGLELGFKAITSGPLVRSSYQAEQTYKETICMI